MPRWLVGADESGVSLLVGFLYGRPAATPPPAVTTLFGYNAADATELAQRQAWWGGRAPIVRIKDSNFIPATWAITTADAPEQRCAFSFKPDSTGTLDAAGVAAGNGTSQLTDFLESIPAGWYVPITYYPEPNAAIRAGTLTVDQYRAGYEQLRAALDAATLQAGTVVEIAANFLAYRISETPTYFDNSWVPPRGVADIFTASVYGNPGYLTNGSATNRYGTATGAGYGCTYPEPAARFAEVFAAAEANGYADSWGVLEVNAPARDWDLTEAGRALWHQDVIDLCLAPPMTGSVPAKLFLAWEGTDTPWDQTYGRVSGDPLDVADVLNPYIVGTPVGGV